MLRAPVLALIAGAAAAAAPVRTPTVDGVLEPGEWSGARREPLSGGGEVLWLRSGDDLYVAVLGPRRGFPTLCIGDAERVEVLHASAALGTVAYTRRGATWARGAPFTWLLRDAPEPPSAADREAFLSAFGWISTASRAGAPARELRVRLGPGRRFFGVVFLSVETMEASFWPRSLDEGCRDLRLLRGDAPERLRFAPARWQAAALRTEERGARRAAPGP